MSSRTGRLTKDISGVDAEGVPGALEGGDIRAAGSMRGLFAEDTKFPFHRGVVVEVINDVHEFELLLQEGGKYAGKCNNVEVAAQATRNSVLIAPFGDGKNDKLLVCIPFFPSHIMMPIKTGETVWWLPGPSLPYWFSRVASTDQVEDVNYTHLDQELITSIPLDEDAKQKLDKQEGSKKKVVPRKNDGLGGEVGGISNVHPDYSPSKIASPSMWKNIAEPVPRWTPRVGDLVLQGSNNTLISLGTDRGWHKKSDELDEAPFEFSNGATDVQANSGTIDIVVGRGMFNEDASPSSESSDGAAPDRTKPRTVKSAEGDIVTDKTFEHNDLEPNRSEGDPDFDADLSRLYISMNSEIDLKLCINEEYNDPIFGTFDDMAGPSIALKSNEIRIVSREDGSVRILKEKGEGQGSSIVMMPDGTIHISGDKIFIGQPGGNGEGENGSEAYVLHSYLKDWCNKLHTELDVFCQTLMTHVTPGYGVPSPQITSAATTMKANLITVKQIINNFPSQRIYGE